MHKSEEQVKNGKEHQNIILKIYFILKNEFLSME